MLVPDRRRRLLDQVRRQGSAEVEHLSAALGVSASTIRRDLARLEADGSLLRARGGAYIERGPRSEDRIADGTPDRAGSTDPPSTAAGNDAKRRIGRAAAERVHDDMTVMILAGSTTSQMLPLLAPRSLTVVTNGLDIAHELAGYPDISLVVLGGMLHREQMTLLGPMTAQNMADLHVDVLFAGAYGVDPEVGVTGAKVIQAGYHHSMLRHTDSLVVLADATKFGRRGPTLLAGIDQVAEFVTDRDAPAPVIESLRGHGASVTVC